MNFTEAILTAAGAAALLTALLAGAIFVRKGAHPATYSLSQNWTHEPILWAAVDEHMFDHEQDEGGHSGVGGELKVGGGASGTW